MIPKTHRHCKRSNEMMLFTASMDCSKKEGTWGHAGPPSAGPRESEGEGQENRVWGLNKQREGSENRKGGQKTDRGFERPGLAQRLELEKQGILCTPCPWVGGGKQGGVKKKLGC